MALTKISRGLLDTGVSDSSDATAITIDSSERVLIGTTTASVGVPLTVYDSDTSQFNIGGAQAGISNNVYFNGSAWANRNSSVGGGIVQIGTGGDFAFRRATSGSSPTLTYSAYIDGSGNVGINTSSPTTNSSSAISLNVNGGIILNNTGTSSINYVLESRFSGSNHLTLGYVGNGSTHTAAQIGAQNNLPLTFASGGSERMRVISDGTVAIGTTITGNYGGGSLVVSSNNNFGITVGVNANNGYRTYRHVYSSGVHEFSSSANTASLSNAGAWTNASDRAYKKDIVDTQYGLDTILNLQPRDFTIKADESSDTGFIAQELETVLPQFVIGEEGHKNVNYAQITAVLTKAVQELKTELDAAKARIETLENA